MLRINAFLNNNAELANISKKTQSLSAYQKIWATVAPETLSPYTQAGEMNHKRLTVYASNGAVAAKVKLLLPSLLTKLQKHGLEVTSIRVQVQVQSSPRKPQKPARKLSHAAASELKKLAEKLDSDSSLANTLKKLAARSVDPAE